MTSRIRSLRPSPAIVISCLALFMALTGSALAVGLAKNSVRSPQIANGAVRAVDLHGDSVRSDKIAPNAVGSEEIAENAVGSSEIAENAVESPQVAPDSLTAADLGAASVTSSEVADQSLTSADLGPDSVGSSELGTITPRSNSEAIKAGASGSISVSCAAGEQVISGGGQPGHFGVEMTSSRPSGNGWLYQAKNNNGSDSTITVFALCLAG